MDLNNIKLPARSGKKKKMSRRDMPVKRSINLAKSQEKPLNLRIAIPALVLIILGAIALSKFAVVDRLVAMSRAQSEVVAVQAQLNEYYATIEGMEDLTEEYAHYTYSGMTQEEIERTDRVKVLQLIQKVILPRAVVNNWTVNGNLLSLSLYRSSLQEINELVQKLNTDNLVDYCTVTTANTGSQSADPNAMVNAQVLVYLKKNSGDEEQTQDAAADESEGDLVNDAIDTVTDTVVGGVAGDLVGELQEGKEAAEAQ